MPYDRDPEHEPIPAAQPAEATFESAMDRLERIVEQMENSKLPLEELIRCYEEGTGLIKVCTERLSVAEQRIEIISRDAAGQPKISEYPPPTAALPPAPPPRTARETRPIPEAPAAAAVVRPNKQHNEVSLF